MKTLKSLALSAVAAGATLGFLALSAPVRADAGEGTELNGISLNGFRVNGVRLNGMRINGISLNGWTLNGLTLNGVDVGTLGEGEVFAVTLPE